MTKITKLFTALAAVVALSLGLLALPASAQDYNGGEVPAVVERTDDPGAQGEAAQAETAQAVSAEGTLPFTGSDSAPVLQIGVALVAAGLLITLVVRSRIRSSAS